MNGREEHLTGVHALIPKDKFDTTHMEELRRLTDEEIAPILPALLEWIQDINWPVAEALLPVLAAHASTLTPLLVKVLSPEETDEIWKHWIVTCLLPLFSREERLPLLPALARIAASPTRGGKRGGAGQGRRALPVKHAPRRGAFSYIRKKPPRRMRAKMSENPRQTRKISANPVNSALTARGRHDKLTKLRRPYAARLGKIWSI